MDITTDNQAGNKTRPSHQSDISLDRLNAMSPSELAAKLAQALDSMAESIYDGHVIDAYLEILDRKAPMPPHMDAETAYREFLKAARSTYSPSPPGGDSAASG